MAREVVVDAQKLEGAEVANWAEMGLTVCGGEAEVGWREVGGREEGGPGSAVDAELGQGNLQSKGKGTEGYNVCFALETIEGGRNRDHIVGVGHVRGRVCVPSVVL